MSSLLSEHIGLNHSERRKAPKTAPPGPTPASSFWAKTGLLGFKQNDANGKKKRKTCRQNLFFFFLLLCVFLAEEQTPASVIPWRCVSLPLGECSGKVAGDRAQPGFRSISVSPFSATWNGDSPRGCARLSGNGAQGGRTGRGLRKDHRQLCTPPTIALKLY